MYLKVHSHLQFQTVDDVLPLVDQGVDWLREQVALLIDEVEESRVTVDDFPPDYLMSFTPEAVAAHVRVHRDNYNVLQQKAILFPRKQQAQWSLLIMCRGSQRIAGKKFVECSVFIISQCSTAQYFHLGKMGVPWMFLMCVPRMA